ncbi:MAG: DeoR/GlpR family DNA-binding transcription regulator, partial [Clostridia bacterium]
LIRFHGGASLKPQVSDESPKFKSKESMNYSQKVQIAKVVASLINDNDTVFINAGTTTFEVIRELSKKPIKIITNSVPAPSLFENSPSRLISTGGEFNAKNQSFTGDLATSIVNKIYASACVLGVNGFSSTDGITTADYLETMINELFLKRCKGLKIVAADGSKIGKTFCFTSASLSYIDILVTDSSANRDELAKFKELGIKIIIADAVQ